MQKIIIYWIKKKKFFLFFNINNLNNNLKNFFNKNEIIHIKDQIKEQKRNPSFLIDFDIVHENIPEMCASDIKSIIYGIFNEIVTVKIK